MDVAFAQHPLWAGASREDLESAAEVRLLLQGWERRWRLRTACTAELEVP